MTQRSQDRQSLGKRGAAQRKARRLGYEMGRLNPHWFRHNDENYTSEIIEMWSEFDFPASPNLRAAYRHGAHDYARKRKEIADAVA